MLVVMICQSSAASALKPSAFLSDVVTGENMAAYIKTTPSVFSSPLGMLLRQQHSDVEDNVMMYQSK